MFCISCLFLLSGEEKLGENDANSMECLKHFCYISENTFMTSILPAVDIDLK